MSQTQDYVALEWVRKEIASTLKDTKQALERFIQTPDDLSQLEFCLSWLHQVQGTLSMVEFHGAAMLAKEMESLVQSMIQGEVPTSEANLAVLLQAVLQLPHYLEELQSGQPDSPLVLLPLINELLAAQRKALLSETSLFTPDLSSLERANKSVPVKVFTNSNFIELAEKLRKLYQIALLGLLKGDNLVENCAYAQKVINRLQSFTKRTPLGPYLELQHALFTALAKGYLELSPGFKKQLRTLDQLLKELVDNTEQRIQQLPSEEDFRAGIYYLATVAEKDEEIDSLKDLYGIKTTLLTDQQLQDSRQRLQGPDQEALDSVSAALRHELDQLTAEIESQKALPESARVSQPLAERLKSIADTLVLLGQGLLGDQGRKLAGKLSNEPLTDELLEHLATLLLNIDTSLSQLGQREQLSQDQQQLLNAQRALVLEMVQQMESCKERLAHFLANSDQQDLIAELPQQLRQDSKSLALAGMMRPADVLQGLAYFIEQGLSSQPLPDLSTLNHLADVVTTLEYYFERYHKDGGQHLQFLLDRAEQHLLELSKDLPTSELPSVQQSVADEDPTVSEAEQDEPLDNSSTEARDRQQNNEINTAENDLIDDDIIEVFLEEVEEVAENLNAWLPLLQNASEPDPSGLVEVRRSFHTLKGSGRMVGATDIGEAAWAMEQTLNAVLDGSLPFSQQQIQLGLVLYRRLPELVQAFRSDKLTETLAQDLRWIDEFAVKLRAGELVDWPEPWQSELAVLNEQPTSIEEQATQEAQTVSEQPELEAEPDSESTLEIDIDSDFADQPKSSDEISVADEQEPEVSDVGDLEEQIPVVEVDAIPLLPTQDVLGDSSDDIPLLDQEDELPTLTMDQAVMEQEQQDAEDELLQMFEQELQNHLQVLQSCFSYARETGDCSWSDYMQRSWHTIKGSAGMASVANIANLASTAESLIKQLRDVQIEPDWDIFSLLEDAHQQVIWLNQERQAGRNIEPDSDLMFRFELILEEALARDAETEAKVSGLGLMSLYENDSMVEVLNADACLQRWYASGDYSAIAQLAENLFTLADVAFAIELKTIYTHCQALGEACNALCQSEAKLDSEQFALLTLGLSTLLNQFDRMAADQSVRPQIEMEINLRELAAQLLPVVEDEVYELDQPIIAEKQDAVVFEQQAESELSHAEPSDAQQELLTEQLTDLQNLSDHDESEQELFEQPDSAAKKQQTSSVSSLLPTQIAPESVESTSFDSLDPASKQWRLAQFDETFEIFIEEAEDLLIDLSRQQSNWQAQPEEAEIIQSLQRDLHTLKGAARMAEVSPVGDLCHELESIFEYLAAHADSHSPQLFQLIEASLDALQGMIHQLQSDHSCFMETQLLTRLQQVYQALVTGKPIDQDDQKPDAELLPAIPDQGLGLTIPDWWTEHDQGDAELLLIFLDEANDLCQQLVLVARAWATAPANDDLSDDVKRLLHTLKGGAGVAQLGILGQYLHQLETKVIGASLKTRAARFYQEFQQQCQELGDQVNMHLARLNDQGIKQEQVTQLAKVAVVNQVEKTQVNTVQETVRVPANLLESLVNLAGETSISRARLEQQVTDFGYTLNEVESTLKRLREQVRRLDRETEAQVQFRQEKAMEAEQQGGEGFDPLEFDRYSTIQQLSRALVESASDLFDLKNTLVDKSRDAETLLLQQSRINTELQEGLMQTRMVPFARLLPRLRRLVRQVSEELGKDVQLLVENEEGELDRTVLDRLLAPIEHMLRNAIAHGIEPKAERQQLQKAQTGHIGIAVSREGGDVVLRISDDGRGLSAEKIRAKARERNMLADDEQLSDDQVYQLIMQPGFSTADKVTQISGRGVGMDVVVNELKELSGNLEIQSREGKGTTFVVRIPFTVSVNRSLMVSLGEELFAMPLNTVEAIVRVPYGSLKNLLQNNEPYYYLEQPYQINYLSSVLDLDHSPLQFEDHSLVPLLLAKGKMSGMGLAVFVDQLLGAREVVVKSIGPSFARVPGLSGATILGDGRVVVILDLPNLWRSEIMQLPQQQSPKLFEQKRSLPLVMVVDDSVTVRKVSSRLLERSGYRVVTAKDGIDALTQLQEIEPDIFLLDIEMPRMDGFELASRLRHDEKYEDTPIIMITSRTGEKHRQRAMTIGVNEYLGKPFQEAQLLAKIELLLAEQRTDI